jgi:hypothetical protein
MGNMLYVIVAMLVGLWMVSFIGYGAGPLIHILLLLAIITLAIRLLKGKNVI